MHSITNLEKITTMDINSILRELAGTRKAKEKMDILLKYQDNELLKECFRLAYEPRLTYYFNDTSMLLLHLDDGSERVDLMPCLEGLKLLNDRVYTGGDAIEFVNKILFNLSYDDGEVFIRVLTKDLKCGVGAGTINKVWPDLVYVHPYMRCASCNEKNLAKIVYPAISQEKADGLYSDAIFDGESVTHYTRAGNVLPMYGLLDDDIITLCDANPGVIQGEFVILNEDGVGFMPRKVSNGILNSFYDEEIAKRVRYIVWGYVPYDEFFARKATQEYHEMWDVLESRIMWVNETNTHIIPAPTKVVHSFEDASDHYQEIVKAGREGTIIKNYGLVWKHNTSGVPDAVKMKEIKECELRVIGWNPADPVSRIKGGIGSLICVSECGGLRVNVSGLLDSERGIESDGGIGYQPIVGFDHNQYNDKIISVIFNEVIDDKNSPDLKSLFLPRCKKGEESQMIVRFDKTEADTLAYILEL